MFNLDDTLDDAADTLRFTRFDFDFEAADSEATSIYDLRDFDAQVSLGNVGPSKATTIRRRRIRDTRENLLRLREALAAGWDVAPELAYEERQLAALEAAA